MRITLLAFFFIILIGLTTASSQREPKLNQTCVRDISISQFQKTVAAQGGLIDSIHLNKGLAVIIISPTDAGTKAIQDQAHRYVSEQQEFKTENLDVHCKALVRAIAAGKVNFELHDIASGVMLLYTAEAPDMIVVTQEDCCKWCVCDNGTPKGGCRRCC
jgi:hypothetical protein